MQWKDDASRHEGNARFEGFCIDLLDEISKRVGFKYQIYLVPDGKFGSKNQDGSWNGMIKELMIGVSSNGLNK